LDDLDADQRTTRGRPCASFGSHIQMMRPHIVCGAPAQGWNWTIEPKPFVAQLPTISDRVCAWASSFIIKLEANARAINDAIGSFARTGFLRRSGQIANAATSAW
jgi:hypothetical protein